MSLRAVGIPGAPALLPGAGGRLDPWRPVRAEAMTLLRELSSRVPGQPRIVLLAPGPGRILTPPWSLDLGAAGVGAHVLPAALAPLAGRSPDAVGPSLEAAVLIGLLQLAVPDVMSRAEEVPEDIDLAAAERHADRLTASGEALVLVLDRRGDGGRRVVDAAARAGGWRRETRATGAGPELLLWLDGGDAVGGGDAGSAGR